MTKAPVREILASSLGAGNSFYVVGANDIVTRQTRVENVQGTVCRACKVGEGKTSKSIGKIR